MSAIVFGSINMDLVARTSRLPVPGETLLGETFSTVPGGKGANQAVAVARLGAPTHLVGRVGGDSFGQELLSSLQAAGVRTDGVLVDASVHSGIAIIAIDAQAENQIIVIPGANGQINQEDCDRLLPLLSGAKVLLLQLEVPLPAVLAVAQAAQQAGVTVILDPAPARDTLPAELYGVTDILTPNAVEAGQLVGFAVDSPETGTRAAQVLLQRGVKTAIVKLGRQGVVCATAEQTFLVPAFAVEAVDTVAAGDAFNGGLAAALVEGLDLRQAIVWGSAAGALAVMKPGAQSSIPDRAALDTFLRERAG